MSTVSFPKPIIMLCFFFFFTPNFFFFSVVLEKIPILFYMFLIHFSFLHVQSLGWSPDLVCVNHCLTTKAESLPTPMLPQLFIQMFGNTDAKERMKIHVSSVLILCSVCVRVCACVRKCVCLQ